MEADLIENIDIVKVLQQINLRHDAPVRVRLARTFSGYDSAEIVDENNYYLGFVDDSPAGV